MAHKTLISGTAYSVTGGRELIGGTGYAKKKGRVLLNGTGYDIPFSSGIPIGTLPVGSVVKIGVNGKSYDFLVVNQGIPSNSILYDSSCDGTWLLMKDCYEKRAWSNDTSSKYEDSKVNTYLNGTFLNLIDVDVRNAIKQIKIPYRSGGPGGTDYSGASGLSCKSFILAMNETGWTTSNPNQFPNDGAKLAYFNESSGADQKRIANLDGTPTSWWLRSPNKYSRGLAYNVSSNGVFGDEDEFATLGVRPAFTLPGTFPVIQNPDGTYSPAA